MKPLVSVVMPLYNKEKSVPRAINSILKQTEQNFELIVVNDGSTDHSETIVKSINTGGKLKLINQENGGASAARNRGIEEASADLIAFLDADDEWLPEFLETILDLHAQFSEAEVFGTFYYKQDKNGYLLLFKNDHIFYKNWKGIIQNYFEVACQFSPFNSSSVAATKHILEKIGGFPLGVKVGQDVDTWTRLSVAANIAYCNKPLAIIHLGSENRSHSYHPDPSEELHQVNTLRHLLDSGAVPEQFRQSAFEYLAKNQLRFAYNFLELGNIKSAKELIRSSKGTKKYITKWYWLSFCASIPPFLYSPFVKLNKLSLELRIKIGKLRRDLNKKLK